MKTKNFYPLLGLIFGLLFISCNKKNPNIAVPPKSEEKTEVQLSLSKTYVEQGDSVAIQIFSESGVNILSVSLNNGKYLSGAMDAGNTKYVNTGLLLYSTFVKVATNTGKTHTIAINVIQNSNNKNKIVSMASKVYHLISVKSIDMSGNVFYESTLSNDQKNQRYYYYSNGTAETLNDGQTSNSLNAKGGWGFSPDGMYFFTNDPMATGFSKFLYNQKGDGFTLSLKQISSDKAYWDVYEYTPITH